MSFIRKHYFLLASFIVIYLLYIIITNLLQPDIIINTFLLIRHQHSLSLAIYIFILIIIVLFMIPPYKCTIKIKHYDKVINAYKLLNLLQKAKGFMLEKNDDIILIFQMSKIENKFHMHLVFFPIYAIGLDNKKRVISITRMEPGQEYNILGRIVIEVPEKLWKKHFEGNIKVGNKLEYTCFSK